MESLQQWWISVMEVPGARWIIWGSSLAALLFVTFYVLQLIRNLAIGGSRNSHDYLGEFRKMRNEGKLDDSEYKRLTSVIPIPEAVSESPESDLAGDQALTAAAKEVIQKAAAAKKGSSSVKSGNSSDDAATRRAADSELDAANKTEDS